MLFLEGTFHVVEGETEGTHPYVVGCSLVLRL